MAHLNPNIGWVPRGSEAAVIQVILKVKMYQGHVLTHQNKVMIPHPAVFVLEEEQEVWLYICYTIEILPPTSQ